ncbi:GlcNAc-PI de-N-acetylase [Mycolicibacterium sp. 018/SC-01/001]|uniref:PIG-L deacetylase family protein n=1 Tax=Mycolicibacterium sp. 018/SC-01/001 TaxID=2592069 RepID=UPI00117FD7D9|nr:PIG-L family deacetylase [Mycolicibacterium sp. 018/SC-01/001]TRW89165.1 GlcNAc-PI de-N-acetylase [Mycolicibacterium sp. 018/SC-01/001]
MNGGADRAPVLMMVHAHPDDESSLTGGTLARYGAAGVRTILVTCTDGGQGDDESRDGSTAHDRQRVAARRSSELRVAAEILGVDELIMLGYPDSGDGASLSASVAAEVFSRRAIDPLIQQLAHIIGTCRPDVIVTYPPNGLSGHPDHIRTHDIVAAAHEKIILDAELTDDVDPKRTRQNPRLFYAVVSSTRMSDLHRVARAAHPGEVIWVPPTEMAVDDDAVTAAVDVSRFWPQKLRALAAHASQSDAAGLLNLLARADISAASRVEEYIQVHPPPLSTVASDLFAARTEK